MNKSGFATPQVLIFVLALAAVAGGYLAFKPEAKNIEEGCMKVVDGVVGISNECKEVSECIFYPEDSEQRDSCYFGVATSKKDEEICNLIARQSQKNGCLENISQSKQSQIGVSKQKTWSPVSLLSPAGGEKWQSGKNYEIKWNGGSKFVAFRLIELRSSEGPPPETNWVWESGIIENTGTYSFAVPTYLNGNYKLNILFDSENLNTQNISQFSGNLSAFSKSFSIFKFISPAASTPAKITVLSPNGGEIWHVLETHEIKWIGGNPNDTVWIFHTLPTGVLSTIAPVGTPNTGSYQWTIPGNYPTTNSAMNPYDLVIRLSSGEEMVSKTFQIR